MAKIFISYRREDSAYVTDAVWDYLRRQFGDGNVFLDVGSVPFGIDFRQYLGEQIAAHDVVLVMIGPLWAKSIQNRASEESDFVRIEIESAIRLNKSIIPVRVMGATLPDFSALPTSIQALQWLNSAEIRRHPDFEIDCARLVKAIHECLERKPVVPVKPHSSDLLPQPFEWVPIPDKGYRIGKYPLTNDQFRLFLDNRGYQVRDWWTDGGWGVCRILQWKQPRHWLDEKWNGSEYPVVGISWYEAFAYSVWLSEMTGENITLPTESQWQYASQGGDGRLFPWGNEWDCENCNNSVGPCASHSTTAVYSYQGKGDSPFGVSDMIGNVWEWCLTPYDGQTGDKGQILRGGSWSNSLSEELTCISRNWLKPLHSFNYVGFRLVCLDDKTLS